MVFTWDEFTEKDLEKLNKEKHPDIYGHIYVKDGENKYIVDVECETKEMYGRNGISLNVYVSDKNEYHSSWIEDTKKITTATSYKHFKTRAEKLIAMIIREYEGAN